MFQKTTAARERVKLMVGLTGPSGSGKTYSALQLAYGIAGDWSKILVADTENRSAMYYAPPHPDFGPFEHVDFSPTMRDGYHPKNWMALVDFAEKDPKTEVLVLDSISHEWEGAGGCLDIVDRIGKGFAGWKTVTPLHNNFIDRLRHSRLHIVATMRSKSDYVVEQNDKGKSAPKKVGLKANQREGTDYEFGLIFDVEISHFATASKDRTGLFADRGPLKLSADIGQELLAWANQGNEPLQQNADNNHNQNETNYTGTPLQKAALVKLFHEAGLSKERWKETSEALLGAPLIELPARVKEMMGG